MHFSLSTVAAVAAIFAAANAAPAHRHQSGAQGTGGSGTAHPTGFSGGEGHGRHNGTEGSAHGSGRAQHSSAEFTAAAFATGAPQSDSPVPTGFPSGGFAHHSGSGHAHHSGRPFGSGGAAAPSGHPSGSREKRQAPSGSGRAHKSGGFAFPSGGFGRQSGGKGHGHGKGRQSGAAGASGGFGTGVFPSDGAAFPTGDSGSTFPSASDAPESDAPVPTKPASLPTGGVDVSSISFELASTASVEQAEVAEAKVSGSTKAKTSAVKTKSSSTKTKTKTSSASEPDNTSEASAPAASSTATPITGGNSTGSTSATTTFPEAAGESTLSEPMVVTGSFDGGMVRFGRGVTCGGQAEGGDSDAVFQVEEGGTLSNVIIGADQSEGIHCMGACTLENVWWEAVCEDALTIKQESGTSYVKGGGAKGATDKVVQHNGGGTVSISGFYFEDFGKAYRSCGNCDTMFERHVIMDGVIADGGSSTFVGINSNYGDTATITNSCITNTKTICEEFEGNDTGAEPSSISSGISASCIYTEADIAAC